MCWQLGGILSWIKELYKVESQTYLGIGRKTVMDFFVNIDNGQNSFSQKTSITDVSEAEWKFILKLETEFGAIQNLKLHSKG